MARKKIALYPFAVGAGDFRVGQRVQKMLTDHSASVFLGTVTAIHPSTEKVDVLWPTEPGPRQEDPEWLVPVNESIGVEPSVRVASVARNYLKKLAKVFSVAKSLKALGRSEIIAYQDLSKSYGRVAGDEDIKDVISLAYHPKIAKCNKTFVKSLEKLDIDDRSW